MGYPGAPIRVRQRRAPKPAGGAGWYKKAGLFQEKPCVFLLNRQEVFEEYIL